MSHEKEKQDTHNQSIVKRAVEKLKSVLTTRRVLRILLWLLLDDESGEE
ncbi:TPA: hypothetical protein ACVU5U_004577 [Vibrio parahaemolyticus]